MFEDLVASGEALLVRLESDVGASLSGAPLQRPADVVSFSELHGWYSGAIADVTRTLGADPSARLAYVAGVCRGMECCEPSDPGVTQELPRTGLPVAGIRQSPRPIKYRGTV